MFHLILLTFDDTGRLMGLDELGYMLRNDELDVLIAAMMTTIKKTYIESPVFLLVRSHRDRE